MNEQVKERIASIMTEENLTPNAFSRKVGIDPSGFQRKMKGVSPFTNKDFDKIQNAFGILRSWILTGEGEKYLRYQTRVEQINEHNHGDAWNIYGTDGAAEFVSLKKEVEMLRVHKGNGKAVFTICLLSSS